jgi:hypothetical protein
VKLIEKCIILFKISVSTTKTCLHVITLISDSLVVESERKQNCIGIQNRAIQNNTNDNDDIACRNWVEKIFQYCSLIETCTTDLGSELYDPFDNIALTKDYYGKLSNCLLNCINLMCNRNFTVLVEESHAIFVQLENVKNDILKIEQFNN